MSSRIRVLPGGREFVAEEGETLLDAALRAGLNLRYNCNSGTCGECRARLISGELRPILSHDFVFSEREKARGEFLLCAGRAASPELVIEAPEMGHGRIMPVQEIVTRVTKLERFGPYAVMQLRTPRTHTLDFLAGQAVDLTLGGHTRRLAVASCPCNGMVLEFHLREEAGDAFMGEALALANGAAVTLKGPYGEFVLDEITRRPLAMIGEGTGVAPLKSLIEHAVSLEWPAPIRLWWFAEAGGHYRENYWRALEDALEGFHHELRVTGEDAFSNVDEWRHTLAGCDVYAALSPPLEARLRAVVDASRTRLLLYP